ncbi:hypothetical protein [Desulfonatronum parangueonense]
MIPSPVHFGLLISAVVAACCLAVAVPALSSVFRFPAAFWTPGRLSLLFFAALTGLFVPTSGTSALYHLRGLVGEFSMTTLILAMVLFISRLRGQALIDPAQCLIILFGLSATGLLFYPPALGLTRFDPYVWGYFTTPLLLGLGLAGGIALALRLYWIVFILGTALLAASLELLPSSNIWDYLMDPVVVIAAIVAAPVFLYQRRASAPRSMASPRSEQSTFQ